MASDELFNKKLLNLVMKNTEDISILKKDVTILKKDMKKVEETVRLIPKMYNMLDKFVGEVGTFRQEMSILSYRVADHEDRISGLEIKK